MKNLSLTETAEILKSDSRFTGLDVNVDTRRQKIMVYGFHATPDWEACKAGLEEMGFECAVNFGDKQFPREAQPTLRERFEAMTSEEQAAATDQFNKQVTGR